jgi:hypothetical protein
MNIPHFCHSVNTVSSVERSFEIYFMNRIMIHKHIKDFSIYIV